MKVVSTAPVQHEPEPSPTSSSPRHYFTFWLTLHGLPRPLTTLPMKEISSKPEPCSTALFLDRACD